MGAAENERKHDDLGVGVMGFMALWLTKKHLAMGEKIHMHEGSICKKNAGK